MSSIWFSNSNFRHFLVLERLTADPRRTPLDHRQWGRKSCTLYDVREDGTFRNYWILYIENNKNNKNLIASHLVLSVAFALRRCRRVVTGCSRKFAASFEKLVEILKLKLSRFWLISFIELYETLFSLFFTNVNYH